MLCGFDHCYALETARQYPLGYERFQPAAFSVPGAYSYALPGKITRSQEQHRYPQAYFTVMYTGLVSG